MNRVLGKILSAIIAVAVAVVPTGILIAGASENGGPVAGEGTAGTELILNTEAHLIKPGETFSFGTYFTEKVDGNTAILRYSFNGDFFECLGFTPAEGVMPISSEISGGEVKITVMIPNYKMSSFGELTLKAREDAVHSDACYTMSLNADYVVRDEDGSKEMVTADLSYIFTTLVSLKGDTNGDDLIDLIDLSDIIDWFGFNTDTPDWYEKYVFFDFNNDKEIDISDVGYVAAHLGDKGGVTAPGLEGFAVYPPEKLAYIVGEALDLSGMVVEAFYSDGSTRDVTEMAVTDPADGAVLDTVGTIPVSVSFEEKTASFDIIVSEPERLPEITGFTVNSASIIESLAAYIHVEYEGENLADRQVYVSMLDDDGNAVGEPALGVNGKAVLYIPAAPAVGDYRIVAAVDGVVLATGSIKVIPYDNSIWTMQTEPDDQGYMVLRFNTDIAISDGNIGDKVSLNDKVIGASLGADKRSIVTNVKYEDLESGKNTFKVAKVVLTKEFPSYSFTFTAEVVK